MIIWSGSETVTMNMKKVSAYRSLFRTNFTKVMSLNVFKGSPSRENVPFRVNVMKGLLIDKRSVRECLNGNAILYRP